MIGNSPLAGVRDGNKVRAFVAYEGKVEEVTRELAVIAGVRLTPDHRWARIRCGYCPLQYLADAYAEAVGKKSHPNRIL